MSPEDPAAPAPHAAQAGPTSPAADEPTADPSQATHTAPQADPTSPAADEPAADPSHATHTDTAPGTHAPGHAGGSTPVIVAARRTPIGTAGKALRDLTVVDLAGPVLRAVLDDVDTDSPVSDVILGNCMGPGGNVARVAALAAGLGTGVPGMTVDRQCGSGLEAINLAAGLVRAGVGGLYLAGGVESASTAPLRSWPTDPPHQYSRAPFAPPGFPDPGMGEAADLVAAENGVSRERQDAYAERSHAHAVTRSHELRTELVPVGGLDHDERPRAGLTAARLKRLRPAFVDGGTVTAGNSCGVSDGAAVVAIQAGGHGLAILDWQVSGGDPARPGTALVPAVHAILDRNGLKAGDLGAVEITEAFAGQVLACLDLLGIDESVVCAGGGAIALGHPWGASGAVLMVRLFTRMVRFHGPDLGLAACAIGGGLGVATLVARV